MDLSDECYAIVFCLRLSFYFFLQDVIVQRVQAELSQEVSSLLSKGQVGQVAFMHACAAFTPVRIYN